MEIIVWFVVEGECADGAEHAEHQEGPDHDLRQISTFLQPGKIGLITGVYRRGPGGGGGGGVKQGHKLSGST